MMPSQHLQNFAIRKPFFKTCKFFNSARALARSTCSRAFFSYGASSYVGYQATLVLWSSSDSVAWMELQIQCRL